MDYSDFALQFEPGEGPQIYRVLARSAAGTATGLFHIPRTLQRGGELLGELWQETPDWVPGRKHLSGSRHSLVPPAAQRAGTELFRALFRESLLRLLDFATERLKSRPQEGLSLRLHFAVEGQDLARLDSLPWELLRDPRTDFPVVRRTHPIVRSIVAPQSVLPPAFRVPLRVLAVVSRPLGLTALDLERELRLRKALAGEPRVELTVLETSTPYELGRVLQEQDFQVLHVIGHGSFDAKSRQGALEGGGFADEPRLLTGEELSVLLSIASSPRVVVLDACRADRMLAGEVNPFTGVAIELVKGGFPAVVAMQSPISDRAALTFSRTFYERLAAGDSVEAAVGEGRLAVAQEDPQELGRTPSLYLSRSSERLLDIESQKRDRHAELVDKKFRSSLTEPEQAELLRLQADLDEADAKFYEPIEKKLELALAKLRQRPQVR